MSTNIKAFRPDSVLDFTAGDMHSVYWEGNATTKGGYYEAELLHMTGKNAQAEAFSLSLMKCADVTEKKSFLCEGSNLGRSRYEADAA